MMSKAHTFPPKHLLSLTHTHTHTHTPTPTHTHTPTPWGEGARETGFRNFVKDEHWWTAHGQCPLPYKGLTCLVLWSLCPSNLCSQGVFPPSLVNPLCVDLASENHNEKNTSYTVTSPRDTKDILPLTWKWTKKQKHWQTYSCQSKWKDCISSLNFQVFPVLER